MKRIFVLLGVVGVLWPAPPSQAQETMIQYGLGIDISNDGVDANDANDTDSGPNDEMNSPVFTTVSHAGGSTTVNYAVTGSGSNFAEATDFTGDVFPSGTVTFSSGETSKTITINHD